MQPPDPKDLPVVGANPPSGSALSANALGVPVPIAPAAASLSTDALHVLSEIFTPVNLHFLKITVIGAGAVAGKKAIELFVEQAKTWFSKKQSIEGFEITPPPGMTIDSLKMEGKKAVITLKALIPASEPALAAMPLAPMPVAAALAAPLSTDNIVSSPAAAVEVEKKK